MFNYQANFTGKILLDDQDISRIEDKNLRSRFGYIAHNNYFPFLTLRENLDPKEMYSDSEIWDVLDLVGLARHIAVFKEGINIGFSQMPQDFFTPFEIVLLSVAKALLNRYKIVLIDKLMFTEEEEIKLCTIFDNYFKETTLIFCSESNTILSFCKNNCLLIT